MFEKKYIVVTYSTQTVESCKIHVCNFGRKGGYPSYLTNLCNRDTE